MVGIDSITEAIYPITSSPTPSSPPFNGLNYYYLVICLTLFTLFIIVVLITYVITMGWCAWLRRQFFREQHNLEMKHWIPAFEYRNMKHEVGGGEAEDAQECVICLSAFNDGEEVKKLPSCGHLFHAVCIDMWLNSHSSCPLCRRSVQTMRSYFMNTLSRF
ncbi:RING-H2 finger protein ATL8 [Dendrobium catenatum]|uniref:RING-type E3 ubiquitin transferase n=1 Tax=Dendrobium catenatum TaxID=906689 RepID=A0A2I0WM06_9ASPA|nr:RING-H2 finger protein ATL8 [Dendrobium catenatum]